jgi:diguanylate cyclase (GGDEF)-like protein
VQGSILIVDDDALNRKLARVTLSEQGYKVRTAAAAEEAMAAMREELPQLVLMDIQMPGIDGLELTRRMKADPRTRDVIVVALTAYAMKEDRDRARAAGCDGWLTKPIDTRRLPAVVAAHIEGAHPPASGEASPGGAVLNAATLTVLKDLERRSGPGLLAELLQLFHDGARDALAALRRAAHSSDGALLAQAAHRLAGSAAHIGADRVAALCRGLSAAGDTALGDDIGRTFDRLEWELRRVAEAADADFPAESPDPAPVASAGRRRKVLVADDDPVSRRVTQATLKDAGYAVVPVEDGAEAWAVLQSRDAPAIAVLDWMMPGLDGPTLCLRLRKLRREPRTYVVLLTARKGHGHAMQGLDAGADDYLTKPPHAGELQARLRVAERTIALQDGLIAAREAIRFRASHDELTRTLSRRAVLEALDREIGRHRRRRTPWAAALADLDHLKVVNDTYGHLAGDAVLAEAAARIRGALRNYDDVGRFGGEEFLFILPSCEPAEAAMVAERVRARVATGRVVTGVGVMDITCSIGVALVRGDTDATAVLAAADEALYRAKAAGRNRVEIAPCQGPAAPAEEPEAAGSGHE